MKWILGLGLLVILSCGKEDKSFNNIECSSLTNALDTVKMGTQKYWIEVVKAQNNQIYVYLKSDSTVSIGLLESDFIQLSNKYGCYQTGNSKKYFGIGEEFYIFSEIPPTYLQPGTNIKVRLRKATEENVDFLGNGI